MRAIVDFIAMVVAIAYVATLIVIFVGIFALMLPFSIMRWFSKQPIIWLLMILRWSIVSLVPEGDDFQLQDLLKDIDHRLKVLNSNFDSLEVKNVG